MRSIRAKAGRSGYCLADLSHFSHLQSMRSIMPLFRLTACCTALLLAPIGTALSAQGGGTPVPRPKLDGRQTTAAAVRPTDRRVTLSLSNVRLEEALAEINRQA